MKVIEDYLAIEKVRELQERAEDYGNDDWSIEHEISTSITFKYWGNIIRWIEYNKKY